MEHPRAAQARPDDLEPAPSHEQLVLILVGLIGSGKSTFAQALERYYPGFCRCSQDDLGDRRSVEALARRSLRDGLSVCIDRTNFDESQRATWINIAHEFPGVQPWVIVFDTPYETCAARVVERTGHPTITNPEQGMQVLQRFRSQYRPPAPYEGYTRILSLGPSDCPDSAYTEADVRGIMRRLRESPEVVPTPPPSHSRGGYGRGAFSDRGFGGRGSGRSYGEGSSSNSREGYGRGRMEQSTLPQAWRDRPVGGAYSGSGSGTGYGHASSARRSGYQSRDGNHDRTQENWRESRNQDNQS
ncbi:P-loop containing nucleoside triphosphate hydrolase protein [Cubamyces sp. BRFM 1775]|nr:P-loop containing nucleoside triphosphate hydrolase protein [Cubamyces sp. BRFM 1775]